MTIFLELLIAILAEVISHYFCKWLDRKITKDSKPTR